MEQQQHGFSNSTPRAGSDRLQNRKKFAWSVIIIKAIIF